MSETYTLMHVPVRLVETIQGIASGSLVAVPRGDIAAANAARVAAEGERDRAFEALRFYADISKYPAPFTGGMGALWSDCGITARAVLGTLTLYDHHALTPAPEAPNVVAREAGAALWTEDHRQKMAKEAGAILDEMHKEAPTDGE